MTIVRRKGFILAHFAPFFGLPRKGLSPGLRGFFEPSDDEEFFVVEGSSGLAPTPGVHSQVLGRRV